MSMLLSLLKYFLEGLAVAVTAFYITKKKEFDMEILKIALVAAGTFLILDLFAPKIASGSRQGSGFGIGFKLVGGGEEGQGQGDDYEGDGDE